MLVSTHSSCIEAAARLGIRGPQRSGLMCVTAWRKVGFKRDPIAPGLIPLNEALIQALSQQEIIRPESGSCGT